MKCCKNILPWILQVIFVPLIVETGFATPTGPATPVPVTGISPQPGSSLTDPEVTVCWPAQTGAAQYDLSFYELVFDPAINDFKKQLFLTTKVIGATCFTHFFEDLGSTTFLWRYVARGADGIVLTDTTGISGQFYSFLFRNRGPNLMWIPPQSVAVGASPISYQIKTENTLNNGPSRSPTEPTLTTKKATNPRAGFRSCVRERLRAKPQVVELLEDSSQLEKRRKIRKARAKAKCRDLHLQEGKRALGSSFTEVTSYSLECLQEDQYNPGQYIMMPACPQGMSIDPNGIFNFSSSVPARLLVKIITDDGLGHIDSMMFFAQALSAPYNFGGVSGLLTNLNVFDPTTNTVYPDVVSNSSSGGGSWPYYAIDGSIADLIEFWKPGSDPWHYDIKINGLPGQNINLIESLWIKFSDYGGCALPDLQDIRVSYTTKDNPAHEDFIPLGNAMTVGSFLDPTNLCTPSNFTAACEGLFTIGKQAQFIRLEGNNATALPLCFQEISFFGYKGETDCDVTNNLKWRYLAFPDINQDFIPDEPTLVPVIDIQNGQVICYGPSSDLVFGGGRRYVAPEDAMLTSITCPTDPTVMVPGECGPGFPDRPCYRAGDITCDGRVNQADLDQWTLDNGQSHPNILRRYCRWRGGQNPPVSITDYNYIYSRLGSNCSRPPIRPPFTQY